MNTLLLFETGESSGEDDENLLNDDFEVCIATGQNSINLLSIIEKSPRVSIEKYVEELVPLYTERDFITQFRLGRNLAEKLTSMYENSPIFSSLASHGGGLPVINAHRQILVYLWYIGHETGGYAELKEKFNLAYRTLFEIINRVSRFICSIGPQVIKYPTEEEKVATSSFFLNTKNFPGIIGIIDGTHIRIDKPSKDPDSYVNRKKFFSLHLQGVVNHQGKFIDVFCGYPGSVHDARALRCSQFYEDLPNLCNGNNPRYIIGDSAYPCLNCCLVPYRDNGHLNNTQKRFNIKLSQCRVTVEHSFGVLKQRYRKMYHLNVRNRIRQLRIIYSCCVLHNLADEEDLQYLEEPLAEEVEHQADPEVNENIHFFDNNILNEFLETGRDLRNLIAQNL